MTARAWLSDGRVSSTVLVLVSMTALWVVALSLYPTLPERIPVHFSLSGAPDRWGGKSEFLLMTTLACAVCLIMGGVAWLIPWMAETRPDMVNMMDNSWRRFPIHQRLWIFQPMSLSFGVAALAVSLLFIVILLSTASVARGDESGMGSLWFFVFVPIILVAIIGGLVASHLRTRVIARIVANRGGNS